MPHTKGPESDMGRTASRSRSNSMSSDSLPRIHMTTPLAKPPPSFIASSSAAQIVTTDQEFNTVDFVAEEGGDSDAKAIVTPEALSALNGFLDHLLFNILAAAKSTQLACIRPAVADVLKPRLASQVVSAADEELSEYMGGPEDEQFQFRRGVSQNNDFDLIRSWKLTRLRCMVYTRLGDMEEDDEEEYIAQNGLDDDGSLSPRFSMNAGNITPAAAIFLTSIIEHIGEQALVIAGETARSRLAKPSDGLEEAESSAERGTINQLVVEDLDIEKLALNPTLGRLWRTWRRQTRSPMMSRTVSRESIRRRSTISHSSCRKSSLVAGDELPQRPTIELPKEIDPAFVALPMGDHDIEEIEGFTSDGEGVEVVQTMQAVVAHKVRPHSLMVLTLQSPKSPTSPITPLSAKFTRHVRAKSLPDTNPQESAEADQTADRLSPTASDEQKPLETMYEHDEDGEPPKAKVTSRVSEADAPPKGSLEQDRMATSSQSAVSVEVESSQASSSTSGSSTSLSDRPQTDSDTEVIEGQGMCEKPKLAPIKRPKRVCSKDANRENDRSTTATRAIGERAMPIVVDDPSQTQGGDSVPTQSAISHDVTKDSDTNIASTESSSVSQTRISTDLEEKISRPVSTSGESVYSDRSRTRPKPSPLSGLSHHRYGRSSSGVSSISSVTERAAVQRVVRPSTSAASSVYSRPRRSDSFSSQREKRPLTAGSTTSQVSSRLKGLIGFPGDSVSLRLRNSSETNRFAGEPYDDTTGLDELIRSEETLHYTLTPKNMREIEEPDSPRWKVRSSTTDLAEFLKNYAPPGEEVTRPSTSHTSSRGTINTPKYKAIEIPPTAIWQQTSNLEHDSDSKRNTGSTSDYSHSIRSTGPSSPLSQQTQSPRSPSSTVRSGPKLEARSAISSKADQDRTTELIDFIREGPPTAGARRIPRAVAPFRDTMDSDELNSLETGHSENNAPSVSSMQDGSILTSVGSRTGLLETGNRTTVQSTPAQYIPTAPSDDPRPVRKQRRVPDPYAIDSDDEEDLDELLNGPKPKREEESLIDFLRNVPPPESEPTRQPMVVNTVPPKSSSSSFGMKARLLRNASGDKVPTTKPSKASLSQQQDSYGTAPSNYAVKVGAERNRSAMHVSGGLPSVTDRQTETSALAEFLRTTGPPEPPAPRASPSMASKGRESGVNSLSRLFGRRKKLEV
ncbi:hypothetical protein BDV26DRAFT_251071 [Aspergillus bertholletiae]|uniref:Uncharacterized protein n=1 Tax=Aspergillus bertholletiae TaxID=1226010 RepID=A0A5N7BPA7_9EURO|nr:hypothetical protein BDV26DRAFT_251071 [Aspergillus bertholletiae]